MKLIKNKSIIGILFMISLILILGSVLSVSANELSLLAIEYF